MTMNPIKHHGTIGEIIGGTHRVADLVPRFVLELEILARKNGVIDRHADLLLRAHWLFITKNWDGEEAISVCADLAEALDDYAPPYAHFGVHGDDGASFGFWIDDIDEIKAQVTDMSGMVVGDLSEVPEGFSGEVLLINDHGNVSLYVSAHGSLKEVWGVG